MRVINQRHTTDRPAELLWTTKEAATYLRVPVATLYTWRSRRTGPIGHKVGRHVRYDPTVVRRWVATQ